MKHSNVVLAISFPVLLASVYAGFSFMEPQSLGRSPTGKPATSLPEPNLTEETEEHMERSTFDGIHLSAKSAAVVDLRDGTVIFGYNEQAQLPLASLAKLMTLATFSNDEKGGAVTIAEISLAQEGDSGFHAGERWEWANLAALTLMSSSNDGAYALAESGEPPKDDFIARMNEEAKNLGLKQTYFLNPTGLDQGLELGGAYGSALDMVQLMKEVLTLRPEIVEVTRYASVTIPKENGVSIVVKNTNASVEKLPGIIASKTGFTDTAGGNLVVVIEAGPGRPIGIAVLGASLEGRFSDVEELAWASIRHIERSKVIR